MKTKNIVYNKLNLENTLCLFVLLNPIFDILSFISRKYLSYEISISLLLRPVIPLIIGMILFSKSTKKKKILIIIFVYLIYGIIHLILYNKNRMGCSFGTVLDESRYIANYSFFIFILAIYYRVFYKKNTEKLYKSVILANVVYITSIYLAIITGTSTSSYIEGIGYKGWFETANSIGAVLIFASTIILSRIENSKSIKERFFLTLLIILNGIYLTTLIGTRVGLFGFVLLLTIYLIINIMCKIIKKDRINKKHLLLISGFLLIITLIIVIMGSNTLKRRKMLESFSENEISNTANMKSHITVDLNILYSKIINNQLEDGFMTGFQKKSVIDLYNYANKYNIDSVDTRMQQLIYHTALVKNQKSISMVLFGNGYLINTNELVLEMELPAFFYNFGIFGAILYVGIVIVIFIYSIIMLIKYKRRIDEEFLMILIGNGLVFVFSTLAGFTFFSPSSMLLIVIMNVILTNKNAEIRGD